MNTTSSAKSDWLIAGGLIALSIIPMVGGGFRLIELGSGAATTPDHARFVAAPWSMVAHIVSSAIFCVLGAFQFAPGFRRRSPHWHRAAGRVLVACGLVAALTGLWMTQFRPPADFTGSLPASFDGPSLCVVRLLAGSAMALSLCLGVTAVLRRDIASHQAWMIRAYALGFGAVTQAFTHLPWFLFPSIRGELARTLCMGAGWGINIAVAEWLIWREPRGKVSNDLGQPMPLPTAQREQPASAERSGLNARLPIGAPLDGNFFGDLASPHGLVAFPHHDRSRNLPRQTGDPAFALSGGVDARIPRGR